MEFFQKTKGVVSIFLVIVLVPMMTVASLFIDAGRVYLGREMMDAAGDLALNTALTGYDTDLKELYGLFATAQDVDTLLGDLEEYYTRSLTSRGLTPREAGDLTDAIMPLLEETAAASAGNTLYEADILQLNLVEGSFIAAPVKGANLTNSALLKRQIVDFMKYRSPINTGLSLVSAFKHLSALDKQTELVAKKQEYYKKQSEIMKKLSEAWDEICKYHQTNTVKNRNFFQELKENLDKKYPEKYKAMHDKMSRVEYDLGDGRMEYAWYSYKIEGDTEAFSKGEGEMKWEEKPVNYQVYSKDNLPNVETMKRWAKDIQSCRIVMREERKKTHTALLIEEREKYVTEGIFAWQELVQELRGGHLDNYTENAVKLYKAFQELKSAKQAIEEANKGAVQKKENIDEATFNQALATYGEAMGKAKKVFDYYTGISKGGLELRGRDPNIDVEVASISSYLSAREKEILDAKKNMETAAAKLGEVVGELSKLEQSRQAWKSTANQISDTEMGEQDLAEIKGLEKFLDGGEIGKLKSRCEKVAQGLEKAKNQMITYAYCGQYIGDIKSFDDLSQALEDKAGKEALHSLPIKLSELHRVTDGYFSYEVGQRLEIEWTKQSGSQLVLYERDKLRFYDFLFQKFGTGTLQNPENTLTKSESVTAKTNAEKKNKDISAAVTNNTSSARTKAGQAATGPVFSPAPQWFHTGSSSGSGTKSVETDKDKAADSAKNSLSGMGFAQLAGLGEQLRDNLFVSDYIISMFSYSTMENEAAQAKANSRTHLDIGNTLTKMPINQDNNSAYLREVEYILFGDELNAVGKAYASIFAIRLGSNLLFAFTDTEVSNAAMVVSVPISVATGGILPEPFVRAGILVAISCIESAWDLQELADGKRVPLLKNKKTFRCSPSGLMGALSEEAKEVAKEAGSIAIDTGTQAMMDLLDQTDAELMKMYGEKKTEIESKLDSTMDDMAAQATESAVGAYQSILSQAYSNAVLALGAEASPASMKTHIVEQIHSQMDGWKSSYQGTALSRQLVGGVVDYIKSKASFHVESMYTVWEKGTGAGEDAIKQAINSINEDIKTGCKQQLGKVDSLLYKSKEKLKKQVENAVKKGAGELRETLNSSLDGAFASSGSGGGGEKGGQGSGMASLLAFSYSDYLRLFLLLGMHTNQEALLQRTAHVIQVNMAKKKTGYSMEKAAVYVQLEAEIQVKPLLLPLPLFADVENNPASDSQWYTLTYNMTRGY